MPGTDGNVTSYLVTGEWRHVVEDTMADPDSLPDKAAPIGHVVFTPVSPHVTPAGSPARAYTLSRQKALIAAGELRDIQGREGIWLPGDIGGVTVRWRAVTHLEYQGQPIDYPELVFDLTDDVRLTGLIESEVPGQPPYIVDPRIEGLIQDAQVVLSEAQDALGVVQDAVDGLEDSEQAAVQAAADAEQYRDEAVAARDTAAGHASDAEGYRDESVQSAADADSSAVAAAGSASDAADSAASAGSDADRAGDEATVAVDAASTATTQADRAESEADRSEAAADVAASYRWTVRGHWEPGEYDQGDVVVHEDRAWRTPEVTTAEPPAAPWVPLTPAPGTGVTHWDELEGKPSVFPPESHTHDAAEVTGEATPDLDVSDASVVFDVDDSPVTLSVAEFMTDSTEGQESLQQGLQNLGVALDGKADVEHSHTIADVDGLQDALDEAGSDMEPRVEAVEDQLDGISIRQVSELPSEPDPSTLYLIVEGA